ncbi:hypothetical protein ABPG72_000418 [Tetrahymena utriculariae]
MLEHLLESALIKLYQGNFTDSKQIVQSISDILLDETLDDSQISLCNSKIFNSDLNLFTYLENNRTYKDNLQAQIRKGLFRTIAAYIKLRKLKVFEYIELICKNCMSLFKKEESNQAKETSLSPIIKVIKCIDNSELLEKIIDPKNTISALLNEIKFCKPTQKVKGSIWNLIGIIFQFFTDQLEDDLKAEIQTVCFKELQVQMASQKPEVSYVSGMFKSFRYSLKEIHLSNKELEDLYKMIKIGITEIKDVKTYSVINNALKVLTAYAHIFKVQILDDSKEIIDKVLGLISHNNRDVKENASDCLESLMALLATELDSSYKNHEVSFNYIIQKMSFLINQERQQIFTASITVIIKSIGIFSKAIAKHLGQDQLQLFFKQMISLSEIRLLKHIEKDGVNSVVDFQPVEDENMKKGTSFKTILYRQKQVISFITSFANIISQLDKLYEDESQSLLRLCMVGFKQYSSFYEKYKEPLNEGIVQLMREMKKHQAIYIIWLENLVQNGLVQSIKLPDNSFLSMQEYYETLKSCSYFWKSLFNCQLWTDETLHHFSAQFFQYIIQLLENTDLSYKVVYTQQIEEEEEIKDKNQMEIEQNKESKIQDIIREIQQVQYVANNEVDLQFFYRVTLLFDSVLPSIKPALFSNYIYQFYKSIILKLRKLPRSIVLLKLLRCLNEYIEKNNILKGLKKYIKKDITSQIKIFFSELYKNLGKYQDELLSDCLKTMLSIPFEVLLIDNYSFFRKNLIVALKKGFELGVQNVSMGFAAIECLQKIIKRSKNRVVFKYLKLVIPYLSEYLSITKRELEEITSDIKYKIQSNNQQRDIFNLTISELGQRKKDLIERVTNLLGDIGGESHLIVLSEKGFQGNVERQLLSEFENLQISKKGVSLISWDYEAKVLFPLPLLAKKIDINLTKLLPRMVELTLNPDDKIKVYACEAIHAITIYMIGTQASSIQGGQKKRGKDMENLIKSKEEFSKIYSKLFPTIFSIGSNSSHPSCQLMNQLVLQISRWFANSKQLESPEVAELLDNIMNFISSKDNNNLRELAANCLGQFIKWTLKQNTEQEIKVNHSNIKSALRRIVSFSGQPDLSKRFGALLALKEVVNNIKNESFLIDKFIMETIQTSMRIVQKTGVSQEVEDNFNILIRLQTNIIQKNYQTLKAKNENRSGQFKGLDYLLDWLYTYGFFNSSYLVRKSSFELWQSILNREDSDVSCKKFLAQRKQGGNLFGNSIKQLKLTINSSSYFREINVLLSQLDVVTFIVKNNFFSIQEELLQFEDIIDAFCTNIENFFNSLFKIQELYLKSDGLLMEILLDDAVDIDIQENQYQAVISLFIKICEFLSLLSNDILNFTTFLDLLLYITLENKYSIFLQMLLKPNHLIRGMNIDIFLTKSDLYFEKITPVIKALQVIAQEGVDFFQDYVLKALEDIFKGNKICTFEEIISDEQKLKENELKIFLEGIKLIFRLCSQSSPYTVRYIEKAISGILSWVKSSEENILNKQDSLFRESRTQQIFQFALDISSQSTNEFILQIISQQSQFFQKYENQLLTYVKSKWSLIGQKYLMLAKDNISLLKLTIPLLQSIIQSYNRKEKEESLLILIQNLPIINIERKEDTFLEIELKLNWLIMSSIEGLAIEKNYSEYVEKLIEVSLKIEKSLFIHEQGFNLLGFYLKCINNADFFVKRGLRDKVNTVRSKYFPMKVKELKRDSKQEIDFKSILGCMINMIKLAGQIELLEILFPVIRESLEEPYHTKIITFIQQFIKENFMTQAVDKQLYFMEWALDQYKDKDLDRSLFECIRYEIIQKVLLHLIENAKEEANIKFMVKNSPYLEKLFYNTNFMKQENMKEVLRWVQELIQVFNIFESLYKTLSLEKIKDDVHKKLYPDTTQGNELTKSLIKIAFEYRKKGFERADDIKNNVQNNPDLIGIDSYSILQQFSCAVYNCLSQIITKTQNKENILNQFLFQQKNDHLWDLLIDGTQKEFNFEIETNFEERSYARTRNIFSRIPRFDTKEILCKKYLNETVLCTFNKISASQAFLPSFANDLISKNSEHDIYEDDEDENENIIQETKKFMQQQQNQFFGDQTGENLEMDLINRHPCMPTVLTNIDKMVSQFPLTEAMPQWMTNLLEEVKKDSCALGQKIFIIKIVLNKPLLFEKYSQQWFDVLVDYAKLNDNGSKFFHYFLRDVTTTLIDWCSKKPNLVNRRIASDKKQNLCQVINKICRVLAHKEKDIFKQNIEILKNLLDLWKECIYVEENQLTKMLLLEDKEDKEKSQLWNLNSILILDACIQLRIPILPNYEAFSRAQTVEEKFAFFLNISEKDRLKRLLSFQQHSKRQYCKAASAVCGGLLSLMHEYGGQFEGKRKIYELEIVNNSVNIINKTDKTSKERFPIIVACITQYYPDFLNNIKIITYCQDYIHQKSKMDRAYILQSILIFLKKKLDKRENMKEDIHKICTSFRGIVQNVAEDENVENQEKFLSLFVFLSSPQILNSFDDAIQLMRISISILKQKYERHYQEKFATAYYTIVYNLYDYLINQENDLKEKNPMNESQEINEFKSQVKSCILCGLTSQHNTIRENTFKFLDRETNDSKTPYERLLYLIQEIYQPEQERLWLLSAVPLIMCLSKRTSDYDKNLFDEQLSKLAQFYDWDFRDSHNMRLYNSSQPLTPLYTLSQVNYKDSQGFAMPAPRRMYNITGISQIPIQEGVRATISSQSQDNSQGEMIIPSQDQTSQANQMEEKRQIYQDQMKRLVNPSQQIFSSFSSSNRNPYTFNQSQLFFDNKMSSISEENEDDDENEEGEEKKIDLFGNDIQREKKKNNLSKFFASHLFDFSQVNKNSTNKIRYQDSKDGKTITNTVDIKKRQQQLFFENQNRMRKQQLQTIRKYKIGELPDIGILYKDIIDPLMALSFIDEALAGQLFQLLLHSMFMKEESADRQQKLKDILSNILAKSIVHDFNFVSTIHKTMIMLTKEGELFDSNIIKQSGLLSHSYYTSILLLEESLFSLFHRIDQNDQSGDKDVLKKRKEILKNNQKKASRARGRKEIQIGEEEQERDLDENEEELEEEKLQFESRKKQSEKKKLEVNYWMDLIDIYSHLNEKDQIKGILKKTVSQEGQKDMIVALDLKFSGQIQNSLKILKEIISKNKENERQNQFRMAIEDNLNNQVSLDGRIQEYIQSEYQDTLALMGKWDDLANEIIEINKDVLEQPERIGVEKMKILMLSLMQSDSADTSRWEELKDYVKLWMNTEYGKSVLEGPLSYEMALITILDGDIDRTRYYHKLSQNQFLRVWCNFGSFATASKHEYLSNIYKNYELKEYLHLDGKIEATYDDFSSLFKNWQNRKPSNTYDNQICWDQILNSREIFALALYQKYNLEDQFVNKIRSNWYIQNVKGMLKKGIHGAADRKMKKAAGYRKVMNGLPEFNWDYYKITSKLKLKQLEVDLKNDQIPENPFEKFSKLIKIFEQEKEKYIHQLDQAQIVKFEQLNIQVNEKFIDVYQDYTLTQIVEDIFLEKYADVINNIYWGYNKLFQNDIMKKDIDLGNQSQSLSQPFENTFSFKGPASLPQMAGNNNFNSSEQIFEEVIPMRLKSYKRFANFCEQLLRIIESESRDHLKRTLKVQYQLTVETVGSSFLEYTLKCFSLMGGINQFEQKSNKMQMEVETGEKIQENPEKNQNQSIEFDQNMSNLVLKMLRIIQQIPNMTGQQFKEAIELQIIPSWIFISFLPQMMHILKKQNLVEFFKPLIKKLAKNYPEALIYQFNTIFSNQATCETALSQEIYEALHKEMPHYYNFMYHLNQITHPEHRLIYYLEFLKSQFLSFQKIHNTYSSQNDFVKLNKAIDEYQKIFDRILKDTEEDLFQHNKIADHMGSYNVKFAKDNANEFKKLLKKFTNITKGDDQDKKDAYDFIKKFRDKVNTKDLKSGYDKLSNFSSFLQNFQADHIIEIPGQYTSGAVITEPYKESHIKIQSFDSQILTLQSIRRPKRLCIYGSDEKCYKFLVKGIEDLRLDQRIEQLFQVMNNIFEYDPQCQSKELSLSTFNIIPMTNILGLLEWVDKTSVLKEILNKEFQEKMGTNEDIAQDNEGLRMRREWLKQFDRKGGLAEQHIKLQLQPSDKIEKAFNEQADLIPRDVFRNALERLASTCETYLYLKERFIRNYAVVCVSGYILGIGDRHLENFLVNYSNGDIVSIDFGYSFGAGLGLAVPELMPFRLTRCFTNLMSPIGINGIFRQSMISSMMALKKKRNILLEFCEVFINDPLVDWVKLTKDKKMGTIIFSENIGHLDSTKSYNTEQSQTQQQYGLSTMEASQIADLMIHMQRIDIVKLKLIGMNPSQLFTEELSSTRHKTGNYFEHLKSALKGKPRQIRNQYNEKQFLEVHEQVDCLIDLAIDPNIIGRVWIGWAPII